jgi:hypothetical protein
MFKLNNAQSIKNFIRKEKVAFYMFIGICVLITVGKFYVLFKYLYHEIFTTPFSTAFWIKLADEVSPVLGMSIILVALLYKMRKFHRFE